MAHLIINGIPIECSGSEYEPVSLGEVTRSLNGAPRSTRRAKKRDYRFTTDVGGLLLEDEAELVRSLIEGEGHSWSFDPGVGFMSSRGLLADTPTGTVTAGVEPGVHNACLYVDPEASVYWTLEGYETCTLAFWLQQEGNPWNHYMLRYTDAGTACWLNGVRNDGANPGSIDHSSGVLGIVNPSEVEYQLYDDLVALPYAVPDDWPALLYAFSDENAWPQLPFVAASGPAVPSAGLTVLGETFTGRRVPLRTSDGTFTTGEVFDFKLTGA